MMMRFRQEGIVNAKAFSQADERLVADKQLRDLVIGKRISHDGNPLLAQHVDNANVVNHGKDGIRLVKRSPVKKIDAAVALSMSSHRCLYFNLA
jgi:phage terminase large subunit-like protein